MADSETKFIGIGPLAEQLGVGRSTIRLWERKGWIEPAPRLAGSDRRVYRADDLALIRERVEERRAGARRQPDPERVGG